MTVSDARSTGACAHDPTTLFAGIARQARRRFGMAVRQVQVDTTSFSVMGAYAPEEEEVVDETPPAAQAIAVTYGYSRDHRADLKQWMLALATTRAGDLPLFTQALDGNASDKKTLVAAVEALANQLQASDPTEPETPVFVADSGLSSAENVARLTAAGIRSHQPRARHLQRGPHRARGRRRRLAAGGRPVLGASTPGADGGTLSCWCAPPRARSAPAPRSSSRWRGRASSGRRRCGISRAQRFACAPDAHAALTTCLKSCPAWLTVQARVTGQPKHRRRGRPRTDAPPDRAEWQIQATLTVNDEEVVRAVRRKASFLVATTILDQADLSDQELIQTDKAQHSVERGFAFLKDPLLFLASSVFVKKPARIVALALVMVLCLLVYRLAEHRLRAQLAATGQTVPNQLSKPTDRPTMRWMFQCFEGISVVARSSPQGPPHWEISDLEPLHEQVIAFLGPCCAKFYKLDP
jgi:transposase